ncbi:glycerophosphodiester phosphodiesterase family protein [Vibrio panuliri]|uniref:Glycerophosphoryl diester phosphodiesterase n=1 Tax=Vibrio panuliri TaxID=1381081 RepID=A0ABX3FRA7_9VIBR|nr:glycerophosphodiester phosphodiesterase family protein [Vibrio panuliri]KAB1454537.1 glycerophosphoryl diester phosphodiesterase [Vibrio panuliri]OLQ94968.1 glycerophosphoryl diester phosphodiesterase [Vibrio panuliri]
MALKIVGHRGVAGLYPENTLVSVQAAIEMGLDWIEVDVQPTKDRQLVVCHDHTIDRCSNGFGRVDQYTLEELEQFDFGAWFSPQFNHQPILTLKQLLSLIAPLEIGLNIEVKIDTDRYAETVAELKSLLEHFQLAKQRILISSFDHPTLRAVHQAQLGYPIAVLSEKLCKKDWQLLEEVNAIACNLNVNKTNKQQVALLQEAGYQVWCFTVNNPNQIKHLTNLDAIFSDYPQRFI